MVCAICSGRKIDPKTFKRCKPCSGEGNMLNLSESRILCPGCDGHGHASVRGSKVLSSNLCESCDGACFLVIPRGHMLCPTCGGKKVIIPKTKENIVSGSSSICKRCDGYGYIPKKKNDFFASVRSYYF